MAARFSSGKDIPDNETGYIIITEIEKLSRENSQLIWVPKKLRYPKEAKDVQATRFFLYGCNLLRSQEV